MLSNCGTIDKPCINRYTCQFCGNLFTAKRNCIRHEKCCPSNSARSSGSTCPTCNNFYSDDYIKKHVTKCSGTVPKCSTPCLVKSCDKKFVHKSGLVRHLRACHQDFEIKDFVEKKFETYDEFLQWKRLEEEKTYSCFTKRSSNKGKKYEHFYCQRDGSAKLHSKRKTNRKVHRGRVKVGDFCFAKMKVWKDENEKICLQYLPTHCHQCNPQDVVHRPLRKNTSTLINEECMDQVSPNSIMKKIIMSPDLQTRINVKNQKLNILFRRKMKATANKQKTIRMDEKDAEAVYLLAQNMARDDSLLIFKPTEGKVVHGPISMNDLPESNNLFMFAMQTKSQLELLKKYGKQIMIVDIASGTNRYKFHLITCMVVDENRAGKPVCHCITSRLNTASLMFFFSSIKARIGNEFDINCVLTSDNNFIISSMNVGFSREFHHIICLWHIFNNTKNKLKSYVNGNIFQEMLNEIEMMITAHEVTLFTRLCNEFVAKYEQNRKVVQYLEYFKKNFLTRPEKWAMCHRGFPHGDVNTIGLLQAFHNRLKVNLKKSVNTNLIHLINSLKLMELEDPFQLTDSTEEFLSPVHQGLVERHEQGVLISNAAISKVLGNIWEMFLGTEHYAIVQYSLVCSEDSCTFRCQFLECHQLCRHMYQCSCPDEHPLCVHVHKLHMYLCQELSPYVAVTKFHEMDENISDYLIVEVTTEEESRNESDDQVDFTISRIKTNCGTINDSLALINTFLSSAEQNKTLDNKLLYVDSLVADLVSRMQSLKSKLEIE
ncbi:uncharacterized protein LOC128996187 [Macrosteles quadrilineatus]|uniref:uncharacterized protein LOC128996187 n=1 Tax=Macrosteles quadrilineatus TaxID=74068 RepID=UPI0023E2ED92|nr:uncharacterized protein LOC128996187 [Macrosteles quadrilineatus]XP_054277301.1 uncharacterized protein LOC128996187 [Macrosteles quadrilineatus]